MTTLEDNPLEIACWWNPLHRRLLHEELLPIRSFVHISAGCGVFGHTWVVLGSQWVHTPVSPVHQWALAVRSRQPMYFSFCVQQMLTQYHIQLVHGRACDSSDSRQAVSCMSCCGRYTNNLLSIHDNHFIIVFMNDWMSTFERKLSWKLPTCRAQTSRNSSQKHSSSHSMRNWLSGYLCTTTTGHALTCCLLIWDKSCTRFECFMH